MIRERQGRGGGGTSGSGGRGAAGGGGRGGWGGAPAPQGRACGRGGRARMVPRPTQQAGSLVGRCSGACIMCISMQPDGRDGVVAPYNILAPRTPAPDVDGPEGSVRLE